MSTVYFGGSRSLPQSAIIPQVVQAVINSGASVHVGCQLGADQQVALFAAFRLCLAVTVFTVAPVLSQAPAHVQRVSRAGGQVVLGAGGQSAPMPARFLLRSIAAFKGCSAAVFFQPGPGSLAVAREAVKAGLPIFAFSESQPEPIPSQAGQWSTGQFLGFTCWQWQPAQVSLF